MYHELCFHFVKSVQIISLKKTGTRKCTRTVCSTIADIHSIPVQFKMHYICGITGICDASHINLPNLSCDCDLWKHLVFRLLLAVFWLVGLSFEAKDYWTFSHCLHRISFCSRVLYMYVHRMCYVQHLWQDFLPHNLILQTTRSEIYQWHHHLNLLLNQTLPGTSIFGHMKILK